MGRGDPVVTVTPHRRRLLRTRGLPAREAIEWGLALGLAARSTHPCTHHSGKWMISLHYTVGFLTTPRGTERKVRESPYLLIRSHPAAIHPGLLTGTGRTVSSTLAIRSSPETRILPPQLGVGRAFRRQGPRPTWGKPRPPRSPPASDAGTGRARRRWLVSCTDRPPASNYPRSGTGC
jgi:hypothetical protein